MKKAPKRPSKFKSDTLKVRLKVEKSDFSSWFEAQYGPRPFPYKNNSAVDKEIRSRRYHLMVLVDKRHLASVWDDRFNACLYAWQARERILKRSTKGVK
jgi:hypothetical protein